jgi:hypothetical protein
MRFVGFHYVQSHSASNAFAFGNPDRSELSSEQAGSPCGDPIDKARNSRTASRSDPSIRRQTPSAAIPMKVK